MGKIAISTVAKRIGIHIRQVELWRKVKALDFDENGKIGQQPTT